MKVALVIYGSLDALSGGYLYDRKLVENLTRRGDFVEVVSLPWRDYARHLGDNLTPALLRRLRHVQADVLLQDELNHPSLFWINYRLRGSVEYPIVSIVHHLRSSERSFAWQNRLYARVERLYLQSVDGFVYNSCATQAAVQALAGEQLPAVVAFPAADHLTAHISTGEIEPRARQSGALRLLFVGNLIPRKGLHTLLQALASLPGEAFRLEVVGSHTADPAYAHSIRRQIAALRLDGSVHLHGALEQADLEAKFRQAQVLVVPSSYEGFGIVYLEGMGFGLPCIATTAGAAGEIIQDGVTGRLITAEDPPALAEALRNLSGDRDLLVQMSLAARQRYLVHPTWEQSADRIREFLYGMVFPALPAIENQR